MAKDKQTNWLRRFNNFLSVIVVGLSLFIIGWPLFPQLSFWWKSFTGNTPPLVALNTGQAKSNGLPEPIPQGNILVIPRLLMQEAVHDGAGAEALQQGVWRRPHTSTPDKNSNTVLVGHRFTYDGASVFYHLDKVKTGDEIILYWQGKKYHYSVDRVLIVSPNAQEIEAPTDEPMLTIYTCTPLWSARDRLVIQAKLIGRKS